MTEQFSRTQLLYGAKAMERFASSRVAVFGVGGVGGYVVEALARSGIGALDLIDNDTVCLSNINRQIIATGKTVGRYKVDVAKERVHDINPDCEVRAYKTFFLPDTQDLFDFRDYDYVVDAIDTVTGKLAIIVKAKAEAFPAEMACDTVICGAESGIGGNRRIAYVLDWVPEGRTAPQDYCTERIRDLILSNRKHSMEETLEQDLLEEARKNNKFVIY